MFKELFTEAKKVKIEDKYVDRGEWEIKVNGKRVGRIHTISDDDRYEYHFDTDSKVKPQFDTWTYSYDKTFKEVEEFYNSNLFVESSKYEWTGGSDSYEDARKIEKLISDYEFFPGVSSSDYETKKKKDRKNLGIAKSLKNLGVTSITLKDKNKRIEIK